MYVLNRMKNMSAFPKERNYKYGFILKIQMRNLNLIKLLPIGKEKHGLSKEGTSEIRLLNWPHLLLLKLFKNLRQL